MNDRLIMRATLAWCYGRLHYLGLIDKPFPEMESALSDLKAQGIEPLLNRNLIRELLRYIFKNAAVEPAVKLCLAGEHEVFVCEVCKCVFEARQSLDEVRDIATLFGHAPDDDEVVVCEDCFARIDPSRN